MTENNNTNTSLSKIQKPTIGGNKFGIAKKIAEAQQNSLDPNLISKIPNRLGIIFDDSGSMAGSMEKANLAIETFIKNCNATDTAIALYPLNAEPKSLTTIFASIGIYAATIKATGGTPLYTKLIQMLDKELLTRAIGFSDGSPTDEMDYDYNDDNIGTIDRRKIVVEKYTEKKVPIDTIYIGGMGDSGYKMMLKLAEDTGGIFLHFTDVSVLAKSLKYLTPAFRYMLADKGVKSQVEAGKL